MAGSEAGNARGLGSPFVLSPASLQPPVLLRAALHVLEDEASEHDHTALRLRTYTRKELADHSGCPTPPFVRLRDMAVTRHYGLRLPLACPSDPIVRLRSAFAISGAPTHVSTWDETNPKALISSLFSAGTNAKAATAVLRACVDTGSSTKESRVDVGY